MKVTTPPLLKVEVNVEVICAGANEVVCPRLLEKTGQNARGAIGRRCAGSTVCGGTARTARARGARGIYRGSCGSGLRGRGRRRRATRRNYAIGGSGGCTRRRATGERAGGRW